MSTLRKIFRRARKYRGYIMLGTFSIFVATALNLIAPMFVRQLLTMITAGISESDLNTVAMLGVILLGAYALRIGARFCGNYYTHKAAWNYVGDLRVSMYDHLQQLSIGYYSDKQTGQLLSRLISDTATFEVLIAHAIPDTLINVVTFLGVGAFLFYINPLLALFTCIPLPFVIIGAVFFAKKVRPNFRKAQKFTGELSGNLQDNLSGIKEIQVFNRQDKGTSTVKKSSDNYTGAILGALRVGSIFHPTVEFFTSLGTVIVIIVGGIFAIQQRVAAADIAAFMLYLGMFYSPITTLSRLVEDFQNAMAGGERVFEVLNESSSVQDSPSAKPLNECSGQIAFENVSFSYKPPQQILDDVSFTAESGKMLAIVGPTGVGKTTIISLLMRFYDTKNGSITIDGIDIKDITLDTLREQISIVMQDTFLFNGTIGDNIAFAKKGATEDEIVDAAKRARIHDDITLMPDGYATVVGERGMRLSGGQKQRLSIARAILRNTPILILDEATASVDIETERKIQEAISDLSSGRTIITIAHRLSTIRRADKIIVLKDKHVIESGTHEELVAAGGLYSRLSFLSLETAE